MKSTYKQNHHRLDKASVGIGTVIVFIAMVLVAGISASVLLQVSNNLENQAMQSGVETIREVSSGICVEEVLYHNYSGLVDLLAIQVTTRSGSENIDLSEVVIRLSNTVKMSLFKYNSSLFTDTEDIDGDIFTQSFYPPFDKLTFGVIVLQDADSSLSSLNPVLNDGDHVLLTVNMLAAFDGLGTRTDVSGGVITESGSSGMISFTTPASLHVFLFGEALWAKGPTGTGDDYGWCVAVDSSDNVYVAGMHASGLDFGDGVTIPDEGNYGVFIVKYNSADTALWAKGPTGTGMDSGEHVAVDSSGNVYVAGYHASGLDFGDGVTIPDEGGSQGVFVVKYNSAGTALWAKGPTGSGGDFGYGVAVDASGNVYVTGGHESGLDFGDGVSVADEGNFGVFVVKYNSAGTAQWAKGPTGTGTDTGYGVAVDSSDNVYVTGSHGNGLDFGNGVTIPDEGGTYGVFVVKYNSAGTAQWAKGPTGTGTDQGLGVAVDSSGNVYVAGLHSSGLDFGNGVTIPDEGGTYGVFVVKYNSAGTAQWAKGPTGTGTDAGCDVAVDSSGNVYVTGYHVSGLDFGNDVTVADEGSDGVFVVKYNNAGTAQWAKGPTGNGYDVGYCVAVDNDGEVYVTGYHASGLDFGNGVTVADETSSGVFVVKYR
jgi:archaellin